MYHIVKEQKLYNTICYKSRRWGNCLAYYAYISDDAAQAEADKLNAEKPAKLFNDKPIDWTDVEYFFVNKQPEMY